MNGAAPLDQPAPKRLRIDSCRNDRSSYDEDNVALSLALGESRAEAGAETLAAEVQAEEFGAQIGEILHDTFVHASGLRGPAESDRMPVQPQSKRFKLGSGLLDDFDTFHENQENLAKPVAQAVLLEEHEETGDGVGAQLLCSGSKRGPSDAASRAKKKQKRETVSSASKSAPPPADPCSSDKRAASNDVHPAGRLRQGATETLHLVANTADFYTDDKINEVKRILNDLLASNPNNIDADWLRQMLGWGVALVSTFPPNRFEKKGDGGNISIRRPSGFQNEGARIF